MSIHDEGYVEVGASHQQDGVEKDAMVLNRRDYPLLLEEEKYSSKT